VGEWIGSDRGLGAMIIQATFNYQSEWLYAAIVLSSSLAIVLFVIVVVIERLMRDTSIESSTERKMSATTHQV
jgi:ABC-type nitrate/sulfonate/bicarbonate transport system permease component